MIALKIRDFDRIKAKWPNGFKAFDVWLTGYRQRVDWKALFNSDSNWQDSEGRNAPTPKYHELPGAMQAGIWIQFMKERGGCEWQVDLFDWELLEDMEGMMPMLEDENSEEYGLEPNPYYGEGADLAKAIDEEVLEKVKNLGKPVLAPYLLADSKQTITSETAEGIVSGKYRQTTGHYGIDAAEELRKSAKDGDEMLQGYPSEETARKASMGMDAAHELSKRLMRNNDGEETR